jgi:predicted SnoaL-like aldol condensation-catalyzing enzyme
MRIGVQLMIQTSLGLCLLLFGAVSAAAASPLAQSDDELEQEKQTVVAFYDLAFNQKQPEAAVARYVGPDYIQHNPLAASGKQAFINFVRGFAAQFPDAHVDIKRVIAEGDMVVTHSLFTVSPDDRGSAVVDIFRLENGKVVEHWDVIQPIPENPANDNTMF